MPIRPLRPAVPDEPAATREISPRRRTRPVAEASDPASPPDGRNYAIGYGKPPVATRFKPGQSGNPKGRPRGAKGIKTLARQIMSEKVAVRTPQGEKRISKIEALLHKGVEQALKGNARLFAHMVSLYAEAVPEIAATTPADVGREKLLSATDEAILAELKAQLIGDGA